MVAGWLQQKESHYDVLVTLGREVEDCRFSELVTIFENLPPNSRSVLAASGMTHEWSDYILALSLDRQTAAAAGKKFNKSHHLAPFFGPKPTESKRSRSLEKLVKMEQEYQESLKAKNS